MKRTVLATATASAALLAIAACSGPADEPETPDTETTTETPAPADEGAAADDTASTEADTVDAVELIKLDCGSIYVSDLDVFSSAGDYAGQTDTFTDTCWLVRHPDGNLLWDLGLPGSLVSQGEQTTNIYTVSLEQTISDQLAARDMEISDLDYVAISHSHFDHTGQADQLDPAATTWLVNQKEYDVMFPEPEADAETPDTEAEAGTDSGTQFPGFEALDHQIIGDDYDVFGDGSVVIFMTPGHTPGHSSLLVNLPETGPVLLTGDLWHRDESRELGRVPQFNSSEEETRASMEAFEAKADALGAKVIIQHEPEDTEDLPAVMR
ncbi:N-acyl homoserine lactonase family protein [Henriciella aquimarina]|uniref:N-acyl homoserine lactonase family protein n=1 Tax=Henriciella aquimarina TaxID=545261 RepID=UPI0009FE0D8A|nr:N-acyl homoserine lactonase family protein [Henriciella aquimarina]